MKVLILSLLIISVLSQSTVDYKNIFYVLVSSSKFYFNYRHTGNVLAIYHILKKRGITDDQILLMVPENHACNARNPFPGTVFFESDHGHNLCDEDIEIDYKGDDLTYETILNLIRGRFENFYPMNKRIKSNEKTKLFFFLNGHGGENFFKIQDTQVIHSEDFAKVFDEMNIKNLYDEILLISDSCEAMSLFDQVNAPNIIMLGSSKHEQHALSYQVDGSLNVYLNDRFSYFFYEFLKSGQYTRNIRISDFPTIFPESRIHSDLDIKSTHQTRKPESVYLYEYIPLPGASVGEKNLDRFRFYDFKDFNNKDLLFF